MTKTIIAAALADLTCAGNAQAQTAPAPAPASVPADEVTPKPSTLKLGVLFPSSGNLKEAVGSTFFAAGAEYAFAGKGGASPLVPLVYLDYAGRSKNQSVSDGEGNSVSLGLTASTVGIGGGARYYLGTPGAISASPYVGAGIGLYFDHVKADVLVSSGDQSAAGSSSLNKTQLGFRLNAGVEFQQKYLVEVNYTNAGSVEGSRIDGFGIQAGVRF